MMCVCMVIMVTCITPLLLIIYIAFYSDNNAGTPRARSGPSTR